MHSPPTTNFPAAWAVAWGEDSYGFWQAFEVKGIRQIMRWIPAGTFMMGSPDDEPERSDNETQHQTRISEGYWLADTACTQGLWTAIMRKNPSDFVGDDERPVEQVSWDDCQKFLQALNPLLEDLNLSLPTEAQWEYACRAGTNTAFSFGDTISTDQANYDGNYPYNKGAKGEYRKATESVVQFAPNPWGLYQIHGNVWEWCHDWYGKYELSFADKENNFVTDPTGPNSGHDRVLRGGSWFYRAQFLRSARRYRIGPAGRNHATGFRLAGG